MHENSLHRACTLHMEHRQWSMYQARDLGSASAEIPLREFLSRVFHCLCQKWNCVGFDEMMSSVKSIGVRIVHSVSVCREQNSATVWTKIFVLNSAYLDFLCPKVIQTYSMDAVYMYTMLIWEPPPPTRLTKKPTSISLQERKALGTPTERFRADLLFQTRWWQSSTEIICKGVSCIRGYVSSGDTDY